MNVRKLSSRLYGFGGMAFIVLLVQGMAGLYLAMFYQPAPMEAWKSVEFIETGLRAGVFVRSLHRWGALILMLFLFLHLLVSLCRCAFRPLRRTNWLTGLPLLPLMVALALTGYLLPWDFRAYWSVLTIGNWLDKLPLLDGTLRWLLFEDTPQGLVPLSRWFVLHAVGLPLLSALALTLHLRAARRQLDQS